ncbi:MAG: SCO family protein [Acidobacteriales bacterium]|nr:SCO family protein [Terriglobales bacterium]
MLAACAAAQQKMSGDMVHAEDARTVNAQPSILLQVGIDQKLGEQAPLDAGFVDESGNAVTLGKYFNRKRPVLLAMVYYDCPMLCDQVLNGMTSALDVLKFDAGKEFEVVAVSFDPRETPGLAQDKKHLYLGRYRRPGAEQGIHFLTGKQESITALTKAVGFRYAWDESSKQFAHASGLMLLTPEGKVAQYYYGIEYSPKDMRLGIIEASNEKIGNTVDTLLLYCFHYDPTTGKYGAVAMNIMRLGGVLTVLLLGTFMGVSFWREAQANRGLRHT